MSLKLKLNTGKAASPEGAAPPTPAEDSASASAKATPSSVGGLKLKLSSSQPPTPASEQSETIAVTKKVIKKGPGAQQGIGGAKTGGRNRKRPANDDTISPAAKRSAKGPSLSRKVSLKLPSMKTEEGSPITPGGSKKLLLRRKSTQPKLRTLNVKRPPPPRLPGHGYDSEDSDAEEDPAIQQAFILRMEPGEDCDYIRDAISNGKIGLPPNEDPAEVSLRFVEKDYRRAVVTVRGRMYAAVLVDLPCIVETMKSWDKKGWWKVADVCQMLLVIGRCSSDDEARKAPLPKDVDKETMQYPHGITPPMRWVKKRRFRKRLSYKTIANVEEEAERLLREDDLAESYGGSSSMQIVDPADADRAEDLDASLIDDDEVGDAIETVENGQEFEEYYDEDDDMGDADLEGNLQAMFDEDHAKDASATPIADLTQSPGPLVDQGASFTAVENAMAVADSPAAAETPAEETPASQSSDEDEDDDVSDEDADSPDVLDEDAAAEAAERNQQLEEVADLEREVELQRRKVEIMKNQLLKERAVAQLRTLEEDLRVKKSVLGIGEEGMEDGEGGE